MSKRGDAMLVTGLVGREVDMKLAQECAWQCAVNVLESVQKELGSLDKIEYVVRLESMLLALIIFQNNTLWLMVQAK